ncbi:hypothetical protein CPB84DRAFT_1765398 [Gymnopilus junonius]|uniref:Uncharacterized protein n=1 Tax=Gymnopilus junonius TaxID=109634 RepID=A0A9P5TSP0_GYMJU|nr:hypothetical protein CPB84DRAFT_1765398 [Gymnopilus junonius]
MPMKDTSEDFSFRSFIGDPFSESIGRLHFAVGGSEKELQSVLGVISRAKYLQSVHLELGYSCSQRRVARAFNTCMAKPHLSLTVQGRIPDLRRGPFKYTLTLYDWNRILPSIAMPALKSIENLDFTHNDVIGVVKFNFPPKRKLLPRLTCLTAHSDYIIPFMQHKKAGYFRDLQNISINGPKYDLDVLFDLLSEGGFKGLSITLDELSSVTLVEWILSGNLKRGRKQPHGLLGVASLAMHVHRDFGAYLAEWSRKELLNWQIENVPVMAESKQRGSQSEMYLQMSEHLVRSVCPHMKEFMYHFM